MAKRRSEERRRYWRGVLRRQARSGLSIAAFCRSEGVSEATFHWWKRALRRQEAKPRRGRGGGRGRLNGSEASPKFVPVRIAEEHRRDAIQVVWPNGLSAHVPSGCDVAEVQSVLEVVDTLARQREEGASC